MNIPGDEFYTLLDAGDCGTAGTRHSQRALYLALREAILSREP